MSVYRSLLAVEHVSVPNKTILIESYSLKDVKEDFISSISVVNTSSNLVKMNIKRLILLQGTGQIFDLPGTRLSINVKSLYSGKLSAKTRSHVFPIAGYKMIQQPNGTRPCQLFGVDCYKDQTSILDDLIKKGNYVLVDSETKKKQKLKNENVPARTQRTKTNKNDKAGVTLKSTQKATVRKEELASAILNAENGVKKMKETRMKTTAIKSKTAKVKPSSNEDSIISSTDEDALRSSKSLKAQILVETDLDKFKRIFGREPEGEDLDRYISMMNKDVKTSTPTDVSQHNVLEKSLALSDEPPITPIENVTSTASTPLLENKTWLDEEDDDDSVDDEEESVPVPEHKELQDNMDENDEIDEDEIIEQLFN